MAFGLNVLQIAAKGACLMSQARSSPQPGSRQLQGIRVCLTGW